MSAADFLDTNVLVYALDAQGGAKRAVARKILQTALGGDAMISFQVVQETLHVIGRKFVQLAKPADCEAALSEVLVPLWRIMPSAGLYARALHLQQRYGYSFYDSLIIAAALEGGCARLLSEDLQHGQVIDTLRIENPFLAIET
jgi:predicted nucleic acid-binding protein